MNYFPEGVSERDDVLHEKNIFLMKIPLFPAFGSYDKVVLGPKRELCDKGNENSDNSK